MADDVDNDDVFMDDEKGGVMRFIPAAVVITALVGFFTLAWYAYHSGTQSVREEDLMVVEADKTPLKEKPLDPGGMKFPNQDKTIYDTFAGSQQTPPNVERVLPAPEEPVSRNIDTSETKTWINDKLKKPEGETTITPEEVMGKHLVQPEPSVDTPKTAPTAEVPEDKDIVTHVAKPEKKPEAPKAAAPVVAKNEGGTAKIQLGAFGSEQEAKDAWAKIQKKFPELAGKTVYVVKADLGAKGIFYRLRAGGVGNAEKGKALCGKLSAKGQACLLVP